MTFSIDAIIENLIREDLDFLTPMKPTKNLKYPCSICSKSVMKNQKSVQCDTCDLWAHIKCDGTTKDEYDILIESDDNTSWKCLVCRIRENSNIFPFTLVSNVLDLEYVNISDSMRMLELLPKFEILAEVSKFSNLSSNDIDSNINSQVNCIYYPVDKFYKLQEKNPGNFNVFHSNVNGLDTHYENMHQFLSSLPTDFDVINITETSQKVDQNFKCNVSMDGYESFFTSSNSNKGGTGIYVKETYNTVERTDLNVQKDDYESVWIEIINSKSKNIVCGCIYRHPRANLEEFNEYMNKTLVTLSRENKDTFIAGDFNIDLLKLEKNNSYQDFYNLMTSYSFLPQIVHPTRVTNSSATVIDNIYSNCSEISQNSGNILIKISEHFSQFVAVNRKKPDFKKCNIFQRDYSSYDTRAFRDDVSIQRWNNEFTDVDDQFNDFYWRLEGCVDRHAPLKKLNRKDLKLKSKPWITPEIIRLIKERNNLFKRKKRQPSNENVNRLYNLFRNRINRELKKSKKVYYTKYFEENKNNIKKTWEGIKSIINSNNGVSSKVSQLNINGKIISNPQEIAQGLNNFFVNVGPNTDREIPKTPPDKIPPEKFLKNRNQLTFIISHISTDEIMDIINALNLSKSTGPSSIPGKLLIQIADLIILPLCRIINTSFMTGKFPNALKIVKVIPIHKGGSTQDVNNFRPISLLSIFDKIIEKLMHVRLYNFLEANNILYENQFGFRKKNSTVHALIQITEQIRESIDKGKYGCGIFIDLRKAFDTVNHNILLKKLEHYGIRGSILKWFESYLSNRKQFVVFNGQSSDLKSISCGVPQGSVLGPLLFLIYINDLPNISDKLKFFLFADDTNIYYEAENLKDLERVVNKELMWLNHWLSVNRLSLNISKTNFVIFHPYNKPLKELITIKINKKAISEEKYVKYLGVLVDSSLSWKPHIDNIAKKISRAIGIMYKIRYYVNRKILMNLYYSLIYPHLLYAILLWGSAFKTHINKVTILQKKVVRLITFQDKFYGYKGPLAHTSPLFKDLNILKIDDVFKLRSLQFVHDCLNEIAPTQFRSWFILAKGMHNHDTRSNTQTDDINCEFNNSTLGLNTELTENNNIFIPLVRTTYYGLNSFKVAGAKLWNRTPYKTVRIIVSRSLFAKTLKKHLFLNY